MKASMAAGVRSSGMDGGKMLTLHLSEAPASDQPEASIGPPAGDVSRRV